METEELRIGICSSTSVFHGKPAWLMAEGPVIFIGKEVNIPTKAKEHRNKLRMSRCHFLLDFFDGDPSCGTSLSWLDLVPDKRGWDAVHIRLEKRWPSNYRPTPEEIVQEICTILDKIPEEGFQQWLDRMTPPGWTLKTEAR